MGIEYIGWQEWSTTVEFGAHSPDALKQLERIAREVIEQVTDAASRFLAGSDVLNVNAHPGEWVDVSPTMVELVQEACRVAEITDGLVTPLVGGALLGIGYDRDIAELGGNVVHVVPVNPDWRSIETQETRVRIPPHSMMDLGASAKAWTADEIIRRFASTSPEPALASLGGDIAVTGDAEFLVEVSERAQAEADDAPVQQVRICDGGLATSTTVIRRWKAENSVMHHIIDPRTALPATNVYRTASVAASSCADANAASTAAIILGSAAPAWLQRASLPSRLVGADGSVTRLCGWPE